MIGAILSGQAATLPTPWRPLVLTDSMDATWQNNASPRVSSTAQTADGWITLALQNKAPAADYPSAMAYRRWAIRDASGLPLADIPDGAILQILIERDTTGWPGSTAQATVGLGLVDLDGDPTDPAAVGLFMGLRTTAAGASYTLIAGDTTAATTTTTTTQTTRAVLLTSPAQTLFAVAGAFNAAGAAVAATQYGLSPGTISGSRRLVLTAGCNSTADSGPHAVKFRAWYALGQTQPYPW